MAVITREEIRLQQARNRTANWQRWGPYLSERQWGTIREDYSASGDAWTYFPHDHARSRAYRWGEDGLLGICDRECRLCFSLALWNERDEILKERLFGLSGPEGNHGEDVKECYYYLDNTPTHSYMKALYKYPQAGYPYARLVAENRSRGRCQAEFELLDTGVFDEDRYFDVLAEYAKASPDDILIQVTVANRGPDEAVLHLLPTLWFRNTWSWGCTHEGCEIKPRIAAQGAGGVTAEHATLGRFRLLADADIDGRPPTWLFTDNETNTERLYATQNGSPYSKDAFHEYLIRGNPSVINPAGFGTKTAAHYRLQVPAGKELTLRLRLVAEEHSPEQPFGEVFAQVFRDRIQEADEFYAARVPHDAEQSGEQRQRGSAGLRGTLVEQAVLPLRRPRLVVGRPRAAAASRRAPSRPQSRLAPPFQSRRHFHAGQVGVSRGMRPGTWPFTWWPWRGSTRNLPRGNWISSCANGTCTPTARFRPTNGISPT